MKKKSLFYTSLIMLVIVIFVIFTACKNPATVNTGGDDNGTDKEKPTEYTITYHLNGGINNPNNPESYTVESETIELKNPEKTGWAFYGWYESENFY